MKQLTALAPGMRVRNGDGSIGAVERIEYRTTKSGKAPQKLIVLADDGQWRYSIPVKLCGDVTRNDNQDVVYVTIPTHELPRYIVAEKTPASATTSAAVPPTPTPADAKNLIIPLAAEEVMVTTRPLQRGTIHLHKSVEAEEQAFTVPTLQEQVIIEHIPAAQFDASTTGATGDIIIPVTEERLVIHKERVITEYIRIRKTSVTLQQEVRDAVRREVLTISQEHLDERTATVPLLRTADAETGNIPMTS